MFAMRALSYCAYKNMNTNKTGIRGTVRYLILMYHVEQNVAKSRYTSRGL